MPVLGLIFLVSFLSFASCASAEIAPSTVINITTIVLFIFFTNDPLLSEYNSHLNDRIACQNSVRFFANGQSPVRHLAVAPEIKVNNGFGKRRELTAVEAQEYLTGPNMDHMA